ncbi:MAG TPA: TetR/AcrR family transcriptional regulator [Solirubrobacteraceae bacterium]|nr:TetR/AcrR family transcriptional regulator [Solirubrobacteraceae bacterium]
MVELVSERGYSGVSIGRMCARAKVSRHTFHALFDGLDACFLAVLDDGAVQARALIADAFEHESFWIDGVRSALAALLTHFDVNPNLAYVLFVEAAAAGSWARVARERHVAEITAMIEASWASPADAHIHPLATAGVMASLLGVLQTRLVTGAAEPLIELLGPATGLVLAPYLPRARVSQEITRSDQLARELMRVRRARLSHLRTEVPTRVPLALSDPRAHRARACVRYLRANPGASNREIAAAVGIAGHTQISALLARLARIGLLTKRSRGPGHSNAWSLTPRGLQIASTLYVGQPDEVNS